MCGDMCTCVWDPDSPEKGDRYSGFLVTGNCKLPDVGSQKPNSAYGRSESTVKHCAFSPVPVCLFIETMSCHVAYAL